MICNNISTQQQSNIDGTTLLTTEALYSWNYGIYQKDKISSDLISATVYSPSSDGSKTVQSVMAYDIAIDEEGYFHKSNGDYVIYGSDWTSNSATKLRGKWYVCTLSDGTKIIGKINYVASVTGYHKGLYVRMSEYYEYTPEHWVNLQGRILNRDLNAYPIDGYKDGIYYNGRTKLL